MALNHYICCGLANHKLVYLFIYWWLWKLCHTIMFYFEPRWTFDRFNMFIIESMSSIKVSHGLQKFIEKSIGGLTYVEQTKCLVNILCGIITSLSNTIFACNYYPTHFSDYVNHGPQRQRNGQHLIMARYWVSRYKACSFHCHFLLLMST